ncbi:hypothetical protein DUT91_24865 [Phyllobacterium salinisoli]|uniref:ParD-like family protein n=1 Tax=Phyllobacterium salinisoli TaxID=1899321 RepID=A0A368JYS4_9HYPH|nr:hypothetical protein [Phyllobacterium salinisoli]RCS21333.1 hypothetical protein DUT91_24865 [Phyllobacterium salinisoli]
MNTKSQFATVKLPLQLVDQARQEAAVFHRSIGGQLEHWASLGRAVENAPGFTLDRVRAAVEGRFDPADLSPVEREYFYDAMDDIMAQPGANEEANLQALVSAGGAVGMDDQGRLVRSRKGGTTEVMG